MDYAKLLSLGIAGLKDLAKILPALKDDLTKAKAAAWWPALVQKFPALDRIDDEAVKILGELSDFVSKIEPLLNLLPDAK